MMQRPKTKILVDGGDPEETRRVKNLLGFVDGQTTNSSLIAKKFDIEHELTRKGIEKFVADYRATLLAG